MNYSKDILVENIISHAAKLNSEWATSPLRESTFLYLAHCYHPLLVQFDCSNHTQLPNNRKDIAFIGWKFNNAFIYEFDPGFAYDQDEDVISIAKRLVHDYLSQERIINTLNLLKNK